MLRPFFDPIVVVVVVAGPDVEVVAVWAKSAEPDFCLELINVSLPLPSTEKSLISDTVTPGSVVQSKTLSAWA